MPRSKKPVLTPHAPSGNFIRPPMPEGLICECGATLRRVSNNASDPARLDWTVIDEQGRTYVDTTPTFRLRRNPVPTWRQREGHEAMPPRDETIHVIDMHDADAWERLADVDIRLYSTLNAAMALGCASFTHAHLPTAASLIASPVATTPPPECCDWPMWAAPDGWRCRTAYAEPALVSYAEADLPASMQTPAHRALDAAILRYRAEPTEGTRRAALLAEQAHFVHAGTEQITVCLIARSRGEHASGECPQCGDPATLIV